LEERRKKGRKGNKRRRDGSRLTQPLDQPIPLGLPLSVVLGFGFPFGLVGSLLGLVGTGIHLGGGFDLWCASEDRTRRKVRFRRVEEEGGK